MSQSLEASIDRFFQRFSAHNPEPVTPWDRDWPSPCEIGSPFQGTKGPGAQSQGVEETLTRWQPTARHLAESDFAGLENAIEREVHPDIKTYFSKYWSDTVSALAPDGRCSLLFVWSPRDVERLIENLVGHAFACKVNKTPFSVFFATTEEPDDYYLTVNNETGVVQLETPAKPPIREIAPDLTTFLDSLEFP